MKLGNLILIIGSSMLLAACAVTVQDEVAEDQNERPYMQNTNIENVNTQASPYQYMHQSKEEANNPQTNVATSNEKIPPQLKAKRPKISQIQPAPTENTANVEQQSLVIDNTPKEAPVVHVLNNWKPNEAQMIRGNELIAGLQKDIGRKPNSDEMQQRLKTHMGLSDAQSQQLITLLGY